jgi:hypothetical protein
MKIVGIGLNKTGTTTLGVCLRHWGFKHIGFSEEGFDMWRRGLYSDLLEMVRRYDSFDDWPWPMIYQSIDEHFPGSKFILTRRISADVWFESLCKHARRTGPTVFRKYIYGHEMPGGHKQDHIRVYTEHLAAVRTYFKDRPGDLLEVCWEEGDGWKELSKFLQLEEPDIPFPHANASPTLRQHMLTKTRRRARGLLRSFR